MAPPPTLADLPESVPSRIVRAFLAKIRQDTFFQAVFSPIILVENPTLQAFLSYAQFALAVQPYRLKASEDPSKRETLELQIVLSFYLPAEQRSQDSDLIWLRLDDKVRRFSDGLVLIDADTGEHLNFATTHAEALAPLNPKGTDTVILPYGVFFETDINPTTGDLI